MALYLKNRHIQVFPSNIKCIQVRKIKTTRLKHPRHWKIKNLYTKCNWLIFFLNLVYKFEKLRQNTKTLKNQNLTDDFIFFKSHISGLTVIKLVFYGLWCLMPLFFIWNICGNILVWKDFWHVSVVFILLY